MRFYELSLNKHHFIVTPDEIRQLLDGYHHVCVTTGVKKDYTECDHEEFFSKYNAIYSKLKNGEKLIWENDYAISDFSVGVTLHLENCIYSKYGKGLLVPDFLEPCPCIDTFCFTPWKEQLCTSFAVFHFPENICGLELYYPAKVLYDAPTEKHCEGTVCCEEFADFHTYEKLLSDIKAITKPLKLELNGKVYRTKVRISCDAKKDFENFYFVVSNDIKVM